MTWPPAFEDLLRRHCRFVAPDEPIDPDQAWPVLGVDSFATLILILELEETFGVNIPDSLLTGTQFSTPGSMWATLGELLAEQR